RQIAIYLTREITQLSFPNIGDAFSKKHSTVIYSYDKVKDEMLENHQLYSVVATIKSSIT
ncbi:MAG: helix-turn-helix domain-containing protein, partial [Vampirovibrionia bacterium]